MKSREPPFERTTIAGDIALDIEAAADRLPLVERTCRTQCGSGEAFEGRWRGIPLGELLTSADPATTHLLVEAADGFRVCIDVTDAVDGIVAIERLDEPTRREGLPRLVVPGLLGTKMVKGVDRIETRRLKPDTDPEELERLDPATEP